MPEDTAVESMPEPEKPPACSRGVAAVGAALLLLLSLEANHSAVASSMSTGGHFLGVEVRHRSQDKYRSTITHLQALAA